MTVIFRALRGVEEIGANGYLVDINTFRLLLDCGSETATESFEWPSVDAVWLSHAHFDHIGGVPDLLSQFAPKIYASKETANDMRSVLSVHTPLRANAISDIVIPIKFHEAVKFSDQVSGYSVPTGHLPGSGGFIVENETTRIGYTGDLCFDPQQYADAFSNLDLLICEHALSNFRRLETAASHWEMIGTPDVVVARGLGEATALLARNPDWVVDSALQRYCPEASVYDGTNQTTVVVPPNFADDRVRRLVFDHLANPNAAIVFVNAAGSRGLARSICETPRRGRFRFGGNWFRKRATVKEVVVPMHPSRQQIVDFVAAAKPKKVVFVHGPSDAVYALRKSLRGLGDIEVIIANVGEAVEIFGQLHTDSGA